MTSDDDKWIMVEDEFLSTAQLFTKSLHRQEYQRLQEEANSKNASQIRHIQRPVTGTVAKSKDTLRRRQYVAKQQLDQAADEFTADEDEDDNSQNRRSELRMLMRTNTAPDASVLASLRKHRPVATRAAAGYTKSVITGGGRKHEAMPESQGNNRPIVKPPPTSTAATMPGSAGRAVLTTSPRRLATSAYVDAASEDEDDDLDAPVIRQSQSVPKPLPVKPCSIYAAKPVPRAVPTKPMDDPASQDLLPDSDDDFLSFVPRPQASKFRGKSMAARERARKESEQQKVNPIS
jgi:hypothetical protein